ncbi:MAG: hypothetical protein GQ559_11595 [Desulfobulbaceae bacterium]|nr:hypothetical protein [Desulfobulbaceae bacterium]
MVTVTATPADNPQDNGVASLYAFRSGRIMLYGPLGMIKTDGPNYAYPVCTGHLDLAGFGYARALSYKSL